MKQTLSQNIIIAAFVASLALACASNARAQSEESELPPAPGEFEASPLLPPEQPFLVPDVPQSLVDQTQIKERWFTLKVGIVALADYTAFHQDRDSLGQVGQQKDQWEARAARLMFRGTVGKDYKISYLVAGEYKGFETEPESLWSLTDVSLTFPLGGPATKLTAGKTKETFTYEMVGDAANLPHQERVLSPFFVSRNVGLKLNHVIGDSQRMTASVGVFNDWWANGEALDDSGTDVTARFTGLVWDRRDGKSFRTSVPPGVTPGRTTTRCDTRADLNPTSATTTWTPGICPATTRAISVSKRFGTKGRSRCSPNTIARG